MFCAVIDELWLKGVAFENVLFLSAQRAGGLSSLAQWPDFNSFVRQTFAACFGMLGLCGPEFLAPFTELPPVNSLSIHTAPRAFALTTERTEM